MNSIKRIRLEHRVSAESLARVVGVTRQTIINWESGNSEPTASAIKAIADHFDVTADEILKEV